MIRQPREVLLKLPGVRDCCTQIQEETARTPPDTVAQRLTPSTLPCSRGLQSSCLFAYLCHQKCRKVSRVHVRNEWVGIYAYICMNIYVPHVPVCTWAHTSLLALASIMMSSCIWSVQACVFACTHAHQSELVYICAHAYWFFPYLLCSEQIAALITAAAERVD